MRFAPSAGPLSFDGGAPLFTRRWDQPRASDAVVLLHGLESHSEWFETVGPRFAAEGVATLAYDRRGWGRSDGRPGHLRKPQDAVSELAQVVSHLRQSFASIHLVGLSWGGLLALFAASSGMAGIASVTALSPAIYTKRRLSAGARLSVLAGAISRLPLRIRLPIEPADFTNDPAARAFVQADQFRCLAVSPDFCVSTLRMQAVVRARPPQRAQLLLAETDALVDNARVREFARAHGLAVTCLPRTIHSLIFEDPAGVVDRTLAFMRTGAKGGLENRVGA